MNCGSVEGVWSVIVMRERGERREAQASKRRKIPPKMSKFCGVIFGIKLGHRNYLLARPQKQDKPNKKNKFKPRSAVIAHSSYILIIID